MIKKGSRCIQLSAESSTFASAEPLDAVKNLAVKADARGDNRSEGSRRRREYSTKEREG